MIVLAQTPAPEGFARDPKQTIDEAYTEAIRKYTTAPALNSPLTDYLPASKTVPTPVKVLGDVAGAPDMLPYAEDVYRYFRLLADATPRVKVYTIGHTEEGREMIAVAVADESLLAQVKENGARLAQLADPRTLGMDDEKARALVERSFPVYYITGTIHSPETGAPTAEMTALQASNFQQRYEALERLRSQPKQLADPHVQQALVQLLSRESDDEKWSGKEEFPEYADYYGVLVDTVESIARRFHRREAWLALLHSGFDERSRFADKLIGQPEALPYLLETAQDPNDVVRSRSIYLLAAGIERCDHGVPPGGCTEVKSHRDVVLTLLRKGTRDESFPWTRSHSVIALGLCGEEKDVALLRKLAEKSTNKYFTRHIETSISEILSREARAPK